MFLIYTPQNWKLLVRLCLYNLSNVNYCWNNAFVLIGYLLIDQFL